ncbi:winged helix-turn-helix transcriptional regulator [Haladaptatus sp. CMSO5]|uniref:winged helix-turn-helix transcriptional regulator n=1 Tax=Haladaptatus sp. CMSO5 TaxID=3120514 RepID=UPI003FA59C2A
MSYEPVQNIIKQKRVLEVLDFLQSNGELRFTELLQRIETSSDVLSRCLQLLTCYKLISRSEKNPRHVTYRITERGSTFLVKLEELELLLRD